MPTFGDDVLFFDRFLDIMLVKSSWVSSIAVAEIINDNYEYKKNYINDNDLPF